METALTSLLWALVFFVFLLCNVIVGVIFYKLGLHGRVFNMINAQEPKAKAAEEQKPQIQPIGEQYNPIYGHAPRRPKADDPDVDPYEDEDVEDEFDKPDDQGFVKADLTQEDDFEEAPSPVIPYPVKRVVMTRGQ